VAGEFRIADCGLRISGRCQQCRVIGPHWSIPNAKYASRRGQCCEPADLIMSSFANERRDVFYSGRVQGVGFRWTARQAAQGFAVTGFVKNLDDGRVQLVVEGEAAEIDRLLAEIAQRMGDYIRKVLVTKAPATGEFRTFEIVH